MTAYELELTNENEKKYRLLAGLLIFCYAVIFLISGYGIDSGFSRNLYYSGSALNFFVFFSMIFYRQSVKRFFLRCGLASMLSAAVWLMTGYYFVTVVFLLLGWLLLQMRQGLRVHVGEEGIRYPVFPPRLIPWSAVQHIILKDRVLTVETEGNRVMQHLISPASAATVEETEFNGFCGQCLRKKSASGN